MQQAADDQANVVQDTAASIDEISDLSEETATVASDAATTVNQQEQVVLQITGALEEFETSVLADLKDQVSAFDVSMSATEQRAPTQVTTDGGEL